MFEKKHNMECTPPESGTEQAEDGGDLSVEPLVPGFAHGVASLAFDTESEASEVPAAQPLLALREVGAPPGEVPPQGGTDAGAELTGAAKLADRAPHRAKRVPEQCGVLERLLTDLAPRLPSPQVPVLEMDPVWSKNSRGFTRVVFQQSSKPFTALKWACTLGVLVACRKKQHIAPALMIALMMKMRHILRQCMVQ